MKNASLILGAFAAVFAAASIYLGMQLGGAHHQLAQAEQGRLNDQARIRELEQERVDLEAALAESSGPVLSAAPTDPSSPALTDKQILNPPPPPPGVVGGSRPAERAPRGAESQAAQNNRRLQQEIRLRRRYAEMPEALGLDPKQADQLYDLLADQQFVESNDARAYEGDRLAGQDVEDWTGADFAGFVRDHGVPDLCYAWSAEEIQQIRTDGKIPKWERWREALESGRAGLDDLMTQSALNSFVTDQQALDGRLRKLLGEAGLA
jgi:hypothetical protein